MKLPSIRILFLDGLALLLMYLLFFAPDWPRDTILGVLGNAIMLVSVWASLYVWMKVRKVANDTRSLGEQLTAISLFFTVAIGGFFFWKLHLLGWQTSLDDFHTRAVGRNVVIMLIGFQIVRHIITRQHAALLGSGGEAMEDERDRQIGARADAHSHMLLVILIIVLIVQLAVGGDAIVRQATPLNVAHWLIGILILSSIAEYGSAMWQYHRANAE